MKISVQPRAALAAFGALAVLALPALAHQIDKKGFAELKSETKNFAHATSSRASLGKPMPNFAVPTLDGQGLTKSSFKNKIGLFIMADVACPCVQAVEERLKALSKKYNKQGLRVTYVFCMPDQKPLEIARFMQNHQIPFPAMLDRNQRFTKMVDGQALSEVYLMDKKGVLRYHGRVDDSTFDPKAVKNRDLEKRYRRRRQ